MHILPGLTLYNVMVFFSFLTRKESKDVLCSCTRIWAWVLHLPPSNIEHLKEDEEEQQKEVGPRDF